MLNDADISQFKYVYVFVGRTDLRKGIQGLSTLVKEKFTSILLNLGIFFSSADQATGRLRDSYGKMTGSCSYIRGQRQAPFDSLEMKQKKGALLRNSSIVL